MKAGGEGEDLGAVWMKFPGDVDETGAKVRRSGLCEAIKKPRAAKGGKGQMRNRCRRTAAGLLFSQSNS